MPGLDGFGVLRAARRPTSCRSPIFVTAYDKYAIQAFDAHAIDYLLKPFSDERFEDAIAPRSQVPGRRPRRAKLAEQLAAATQERHSVDARSGYLERLVLKSNGCVTFLDVDDVDWIEAAGVYVYLHVGAKMHLYRSSVTQLLQRLDPQQFVRIHRSAAVNTEPHPRAADARSHGDYTVVLKDGTELTLSRGYRSQLEDWLRQPL